MALILSPISLSTRIEHWHVTVYLMQIAFLHNRKLSALIRVNTRPVAQRNLRLNAGIAGKAATKQQFAGAREAGIGTATPSPGHKKKHMKRKETYSSYVYKLLKQIHPDTSISTRAMSILNSFINDIFERVATEASRLAAINRESTITPRELQIAVRLILPPQLTKQAVSEAIKAVIVSR